MTERWKPVVGYEGLYEVSDLGRIRTVARTTLVRRRSGSDYTLMTRSRIRKLYVSDNTSGYPVVCLIREGKRKNLFVHRAVLEAFVGPCPEGMQGCHNNGIRTDNRLKNLRWDTFSANVRDSIEHGTYNPGFKPGEQHPGAKLTAEKVRKAFAMRAEGALYREIGDALGVTAATARSVVVGERWRHLGLTLGNAP